MTSRPLVLAVVALATIGLVAAACSADDAAGDDAEQVTAETVLVEAAAAMGEVETAAFTLTQDGAAVPIDDAAQLLFLGAEGRIARPASADAVVTVDALGFTTEVGAIAIDGTVWFTNPLTGAWTEAPESFTFDPALLLDPTDGFAGLLTEAAATATLIDAAATGDDGVADTASLEGDGPWRRIEATVSADRVEVLTGGLISEATTVDAWFDPESDRLALLRFDLPVGDTTSSWQMTITDYDRDVDISPPEL